jgi:hypothetical protein
VKPETDEDLALLTKIRAIEAQEDDQDARDAARYRWLRSRGVAFYGDPKRSMEEGLVRRFTNLDEVVDYLAGLEKQ